jgi:hypothetical protein
MSRREVVNALFIALGILSAAMFDVVLFVSPIAVVSVRTFH